jgi:hypothetical protein
MVNGAVTGIIGKEQKIAGHKISSFYWCSSGGLIVCVPGNFDTLSLIKPHHKA